MSRHRTPRAAREGSRIPGPPSNRGPLILAALVIGAIFAWLPGVSGAAPSTAESLEGPYGVGSDAGAPLSADDTPRQAISAAEAAARLDMLAASRDAARAAQDAEAAQAAEYVLPVSGRLTSCFCMRWGTMHWGIDIAAPTGTPIAAPEAAVVLEAGTSGGFGNVIYLQHETGDVTVYGHMSKVLVEPGQIVLAGDIIGEVGSTGYSTGPHLHFETYRGGLDGERMDPADWLLERGIDIAALPTSR